MSTGFAVLSPKSIGANYLYAWTTAEDFVQYLTVNADGSAYPAVRPEHFARALILRPTDSVMKRFEDNLAPLRDKIAQNECESRTLAALRDTLLPKLISGELRVAEAERATRRAE